MSSERTQELCRLFDLILGDERDFQAERIMAQHLLARDCQKLRARVEDDPTAGRNEEAALARCERPLEDTILIEHGLLPIENRDLGAFGEEPDREHRGGGAARRAIPAILAIANS